MRRAAHPRLQGVDHANPATLDRSGLAVHARHGQRAKRPEVGQDRRLLVQRADPASNQCGGAGCRLAVDRRRHGQHVVGAEHTGGQPDRRLLFLEESGRCRDAGQRLSRQQRIAGASTRGVAAGSGLVVALDGQRCRAEPAAIGLSGCGLGRALLDGLDRGASAAAQADADQAADDRPGAESAGHGGEAHLQLQGMGRQGHQGGGAEGSRAPRRARTVEVRGSVQEPDGWAWVSWVAWGTWCAAPGDDGQAQPESGDEAQAQSRRQQAGARRPG